MDNFADIEAIIARAMGAWRPPPRLSLSAWADRFFVLSAETAAEPGRWRTLPYQVEILDAITDPKVPMIVVQKSARVGFALAVDTALPTPTGWTTMGSVRVGDRLFDERGLPCRVLTKSPVYTDHECFLVTFCDGSKIVADAGHRWLVESSVSLEHLSAGKKGRTGQPKRGETRTFRGVIDTATMARAQKTSGGKNALAVVVAAPLVLPECDLPIPPYTLGLWLGDGHSDLAAVTHHRRDVETAEYLREEGIDAVVRFKDKRYPDHATIYFAPPLPRSQWRWGAGSKWRRTLRDVGVLGNKHIPKVYLRAGFAQRLALLRGLMDSDGTITVQGRASFDNTNFDLVMGVYELVVSLGMKATLRHQPPQREPHRDQWRVNFKPTADLVPFRLRRKAARVIPPAKPTITKRRRIASVERVPPVPVQCVEVDSSSHLFLAGWQMVPTHNTLCMSVAIAYFIGQEPSSQLIVQPTVDDAKGFSKETIAPMLRDVPVLAQIAYRDIEDKGKGGKGSATLTHKAYPGGVLSLVGANSGSGFRRISRRVVMFDEVDAYPPSAGNEGDQIRLGMKRSEAFHDRKTIAGSTPLIAGASRIEDLFLAGDQRRYHVPCPHCGHKDFLVFRKGARGHWMHWGDEPPENAHFVCSAKGCRIEHKDKRWMVERGQWIPDNPAGAHRSYHLWSALSYSPGTTWAHIALDFLAAKDDPEKLKTFVNTTLGETWVERGDAPDWERLYQRRETYNIRTVPAGVSVLTAGVDVQKDRFVLEVVGWARNRESWSIEYDELYGDTADEATWRQLDEVLARTYSSSAGQLPISMMAVDSGAFTQMVYNWARRHPMRRVIATKGVSGAKMLVGTPSPVDVTWRGKRLARGYKVWPVGVDIAKAELYGWLRLSLDERTGAAPPGYCHFPAEHTPGFFKQLTAEHLVTIVNRRTRRPKMEWQVQPNRENHILDARILARVAASVLGVDRMAPATHAPPPPVPSAAPAQVKPASPSSPHEVPAETAAPPRKSGFLYGGARRPGRGWIK